MTRVLILLLLVQLCAGCRKPPAAAAAPATSAPATAGSGQAGPAGQPPAVKPVPGTLPEVLAKVNGESVERWELENAVKRVEARAGGPVPAERRDEVLRGILDQLIAFHMLAQESKARKLDVSDAEVDAQVAKVREGFPSEEVYKQHVASQGLTVDLFRRQTRMGLQVQRIVDIEVNAKVAVADGDVDAFYAQNLERFKEGETVHASHILIGVPESANPAQKQEARAKAQQILKQVQGGADFAKAARESSQDPGSAPGGGDLGFFPKGQMTPAFEEAAFKLKPGTISGVVESSFGFHIIKVHERRGPRTTPFAEVRMQIKEFLTEGQRQTKLEQFIEQTKSKNKIEVLV